ncbi:MAG: hypothetical protein Kow0068_12900 [Marinilabiliales bacterium]
MKLTIIILLFLSFGFLWGQDFQNQIRNVENEIRKIDKQKDSLLLVLEDLKLRKIHDDLIKKGTPRIENGEELIEHKAMVLVYNEKHEQAKWVAHIITPDISYGNISRTNDFRMDTMVVTGTANDSDYFIRQILPDGKINYIGYGYDRGHLAPSADFRWSKQALSESYLYSNISPQKAELNRQGWAELEDLLRKYVVDKNCSLYVVTGGVLNDSLKKIKQSIHHVSIPEYFFKVVYDEKNHRGIGFLMPNDEIEYPVESYAKSINEIENITGIDFYPNIENEEEIENQKNISEWLTGKQKYDTPPMTNDLPKGTYNTIQAKNFMNTNKTVTICGTVASTKKTKAGHILINLDKAFPNHIFTITIWKSATVNFSYDPSVELKNKQICVTGKITNNKGKPSLNVDNEHQIQLLDENF